MKRLWGGGWGVTKQDRSARQWVRSCRGFPGFLRQPILPFLVSLSVATWPLLVQGATPPNTLITNRAVGAYSVGGVPLTASGVVAFTTAARTPSAITFFRHRLDGSGTNILVGPTQCRTSEKSDGPYIPTFGRAAPDGNSSLPRQVPLVPTTTYNVGDTIFIHLTDYDQNRDASQTETALVTVTVRGSLEKEVLKLNETGPNTGVFVGAITSNSGPLAAHDCALTISPNQELVVTYTDPVDKNDSTATGILIDPLGLVFNSATGAPINGAILTLLEATGGLPATVFGDDGISTYPSTITSGGEVTDSGGTVYRFPDGGYRFPFLRPGVYRLEVQPPAGHAYPSVVPDSLLQTLPGAPFSLIDGSRGGDLVITAASLSVIKMDIPLDPTFTTLFITKTAGRDHVAIGDVIPYRIEVSHPHPTLPVMDVRVRDTLPIGFRYRVGSAHVGAVRVPDPLISTDGRVLTFAVGDIPVATTVTLKYVVEVGAGARLGEAINQADATGTGNILSNTARAKVTVDEELFRSHSILMGRVIVGCSQSVEEDEEGLAGVRIYLEDGTYVITDPEGKWHIEGVTPGRHVVRLDESTLPRGYEVIPCDENGRLTGTSQFVDIQGGSLWRADFHVAHRSVEPSMNDSREGEPGAVTNLGSDEKPDPAPIPTYDNAWLAEAQPSLTWLVPAPDFNPTIPAISIFIQHDPHQQITLLNGLEKVSPLNYDGMDKNEQGTTAVSRWRGVPLQTGDNLFAVVLTDATGNETGRLERNIHFSDAPVTAQLVYARSRLVADGKHPSAIAVQLRDKDGYPVREGVTGLYTLSPPYESYDRALQIEKSGLTEVGDGRLHYTVTGNEGIAFIRINPTTQSGEATLTFEFNDRHREALSFWIRPEMRDWMVVGIAEGEVGVNLRRGNTDGLDAAGLNDPFYQESRLAFFAKGAVRGDYLLTLAFDSDKEKQDPSTLKRVTDPGRYYTLYGDATEQRYEAASQRKLYLKLEKERFYALFGDYDTGLTVSEFARYSRTLNGLKSEYRGERFDYNLFATKTGSASVRDEMQGDGTSGLYSLTRKQVIVGSDKIVLETRDRFKSEVVVTSRPLVRFVDYQIAYDDGTIFFKSPVPSQDDRFNPIYIVAEYEADDRMDEKISGGGRLAFRPLSGVEVGVSRIEEGNVGKKGSLTGLDLHYQMAPSLHVKSEYAKSDVENVGEGDAWRLEVAKETGAWRGRAYLRHQGLQFGLGQQQKSEIGTRKWGVEARLKQNEKTSWVAEAYHSENLNTEAWRNTVASRLDFASGPYTLTSGLRWANDRDASGGNRRSILWTQGGTYAMPENRLVFRLKGEVPVTGDATHPDYPTRLVGGADFKVNEQVSLFAEQEWTWGNTQDTEGSRAGLRTTPWQGSVVETSVERRTSESGERLFANLGLNQLWQIDQNWKLDFGLDRSATLSGASPAPFHSNVPVAVGSNGNDFTAVAVGAAFHRDPWQWTSRLEIRRATQEDKWNLVTGLYRTLTQGRAVALHLQRTDTQSVTAESTTGRIALSYIHRPVISRWIFLNRLDYVSEDRKDASGGQRTRKMIYNANGNYLWDRGTQISLQYGAKYAHSDIGGQTYTGYTDLWGVELLSNLKRWDVGARAAMLHSWSSHRFESSYGVFTGYLMDRDVRVGVGYNFAGFHDRDFKASGYSARGIFFQIGAKFDQSWLHSVVAPFH